MAVSQAALEQIYLNAHTEHGFTDATISDETLTKLYDVRFDSQSPPSCLMVFLTF